jgi:hypothetical protein
VIASLVSSLLSTGSVIFFGLPLILHRQINTNLYAGLTITLPLVFTAAASIFVYRHTSRRRKLQAILTILFAAFLTLTAVTVFVFISARKQHAETIAAFSRI